MSHDLAPLLDLWGVEYDPSKGGNQKVNCPNPVHEDNRASCSVNLDEGLLNCFGCRLSGDVVELLQEIEGLEIRDAFRRAEELAGEDRKEVPRRAHSEGTFLPGRPRSSGRGRGWKSPWARRRA